MSLRHLLVPLLSATFVLPFALAPTPAQAHVAGMLALNAGLRAAEPVVTSVLGLRSEDEAAGAALTTSLRAAFEARDMSGGEELSLEEVILTLDCSSEEDTACMTEAGRALSIERLVYGNLLETGGGYTVDIIVLDVTTGQVEAQATLPFDADAMSAGNVDATAAAVVESLYPSDDAPIAAAPVDTNDDDDAQPDDDDDESRGQSDYVWGPYKPRPAWKKAGLAIGATLLVAGVAAGTYGWIRREPTNTAVDDEKARLAMDNPTLLNLAAGNIEFCAEAVQETGQSGAGERAVPDPAAAEACRDFRVARGLYIGGVAAAVAGGAATVAFTILHFVHKKPPNANARKRSFYVVGGPSRGGAMLSGVGRF